MPPAPRAVADEARPLYEAYLCWLDARGVGNRTFYGAARSFFSRHPDPTSWSRLPLADRLRVSSGLGPLLNFLMLHGHIRPGYDWLLTRHMHSVLRDGARSPIGPDLERFLDAAEQLGYSLRVRDGIACEATMRILVQSGHHLDEVTAEDLACFEAAISEHEVRKGRPCPHYRQAVFAFHTVAYHIGAAVDEPVRRSLQRWRLDRHFAGVEAGVAAQMVAYLERVEGTLARSTVRGTASMLAHFGRFLAVCDPKLHSLADLDRRRHIEPYLSEVTRARNPSGELVAASTQRSRILAVRVMLDAITEWGWEDAPRRRLVFSRDSPRLPRPLPRYLPTDEDRALVRALEASPNRLLADALLLLRQTGLRIGELCDLELDCVHEVPGQGAWLKVPLGKLQTERMVPLDEETVSLIDRIALHRSAGRPLLHPRTGALVEFLLTHHGRRVSACILREELHRTASAAGISDAVPHQLRHTYATALVNAGCSLQALMALLGHVSAGMSLRYGRLFDKTVRENYERALVLAKTRLGPVLPEATPIELDTDWRKAPLIKARLAGGFCLRSPAQGSCPYANICEFCPSFRSDKTLLPILQLQRVDAEALLADAQERGWGEEAARHRRLVERIDALIASARAG